MSESYATTVRDPAEMATTRSILAAAFAGKHHPLMPTSDELRARSKAATDHQFPVLVRIMQAGAGLVVSKPGTTLTAWVPSSEIQYLRTVETLGEVRRDKPDGRAVRYSVQSFSVTPAGRRILERNGLI